MDRGPARRIRGGVHLRGGGALGAGLTSRVGMVGRGVRRPVDPPRGARDRSGRARPRIGVLHLGWRRSARWRSMTRDRPGRGARGARRPPDEARTCRRRPRPAAAVVVRVPDVPDLRAGAPVAAGPRARAASRSRSSRSRARDGLPRAGAVRRWARRARDRPVEGDRELARGRGVSRHRRPEDRGGRDPGSMSRSSARGSACPTDEPALFLGRVGRGLVALAGGSMVAEPARPNAEAP